MMVSLLAHASRLLSRKRRPRTRGKYIPSFKGLQQEVFGARQEAICWANGLKRRARRAKAGMPSPAGRRYFVTNCDYLASKRVIWRASPSDRRRGSPGIRARLFPQDAMLF